MGLSLLNQAFRLIFLHQFNGLTDHKRIIIFLIVCWLTFGSSLMAAEYKVGLRAKNGLEAAFAKWQPTLDVLNRQLPEHTFTLMPILSLKEITQLAGNGEFDFVLTNPSSFVEIEQRYGAKALATLNNKRANNAQSHFGSVIFTHVKNTEILGVEDLKGRKLIAVSEPAFGGWRVAWLELLKQGFDPYSDLNELMFTKGRTQPEVVKAVLDGIADAGVVRTDLLERLEAAGKIDMRYIRILNNKDVQSFPFFLSTDLYPEWAFAALKHVPDDHAAQVREALATINQHSDAAQLGKYVGWISPMDYGTVRDLMKTLKVGPYAD